MVLPITLPKNSSIYTTVTMQCILIINIIFYNTITLLPYYDYDMTAVQVQVQTVQAMRRL